MAASTISSAMSSVKKSEAPSSKMMAAYGIFAATGLAVYHFIAEGEFSAILTMSVIMQCLAVVLLGLQSLSSGSAAGISARALALEAGSIVCRLSSTLWLNGYLPVDATGDHVFQAVDLCTLGLLLWLLHRVVCVQGWSYQQEQDSLPATPMALACFVLAALLHADMNDRPLFDALWMAGLFLGIVAVLPQLWLVARAKGRIEALTSHYIATMAVSRLLSGSFMWHARFDLTCQPWVEGFNHAVWAILGAHILHLLLLGDFAYYYVKCIVQQGLASLDYVDVGCFV